MSTCHVYRSSARRRLWASLGQFTPEDCFRIDGVTGPDEYTAVVDNNVFTNLMAQRNLRAAAEACKLWPDAAARFEVDQDEIDSWCTAADCVRIPYDEETGVHAQSDNFTDHGEWDFARTPPEDYPLLLHYPYFQLYRKQMIKQADLVLAMHLRGDAFTLEEKARNFAYYEARTVRDSSLSAGPQAIIAAEVGHLDLAFDYWSEAAFTDIRNLHDNVDDGVHSLLPRARGLRRSLVSGGMRDYAGNITFAPRLPRQLSRLCFRMTFSGRTVTVDIRRGENGDANSGVSVDQTATYSLQAGDPYETSHHGVPLTLEVNHDLTLPIPSGSSVAPVTQPLYRVPRRRS